MVAERRGAALQQIAASQKKEGVFGWPEGVPAARERAACSEGGWVGGWPEGVPEVGGVALSRLGLAGTAGRRHAALACCAGCAVVAPQRPLALAPLLTPPPPLLCSASLASPPGASGMLVYNKASGPLRGSSSPVFVHVGYDGWWLKVRRRVVPCGAWRRPAACSWSAWRDITGCGCRAACCAR